MVASTKEDMDDLVRRKLAVCKQKGGYSLYKFHNKVFYKGLWDQSEHLLECRGIVFDDDGNIVQLPLPKVFNHGERNTYVNPDKRVFGVRKVNGFMAALTVENDEMFITTTGSFDSEYQKLAERHLKSIEKLSFTISSEYTYIFEICDESDPHIIEEEYGAYLLAIRNKKTGDVLKESYVKFSAKLMGVRCPERFIGEYGDFYSLSKIVNHEGFMIYDYETHQPIVKLKSPHYLSKKSMMRMGNKKVDLMFNNPHEFKKSIDEEFYGLHNMIISYYTLEQWRDFKEQQRRDVIESYYFGGFDE